MEIPLASQNNRLASRDILAHISPFAGDLETCLDGLGTSVHRENHVIPKHGGDFAGKRPKGRVVEGTRGEGESAGLIDEGGEDFGMAVALIDRSIEEVFSDFHSRFRKDTHEYALSMSIYSFPSGSQTLFRVRMFTRIRIVNILCTLCRLEYDGKRVVADVEKVNGSSPHGH